MNAIYGTVLHRRQSLSGLNLFKFLLQAALCTNFNKTLSYNKVNYPYFFTLFYFKVVTHCFHYIITEQIKLLYISEDGCAILLRPTSVSGPVVWEPYQRSWIIQ